jgi:hypothetical protein
MRGSVHGSHELSRDFVMLRGGELPGSRFAAFGSASVGVALGIGTLVVVVVVVVEAVVGVLESLPSMP